MNQRFRVNGVDFVLQKALRSTCPGPSVLARLCFRGVPIFPLYAGLTPVLLSAATTFAQGGAMKKLLVVLCVMALALPVFGETVFRVANGAEPGSLDPHLISGVNEARINDALFEGLIIRQLILSMYSIYFVQLHMSRRRYSLLGWSAGCNPVVLSRRWCPPLEAQRIWLITPCGCSIRASNICSVSI